MKILIITEHLDIGGVERFAVNMANGFVKKQHQVDLYLLLGTHRQMVSQIDQRVTINSMGLRYFRTLLPLLMRFPSLVRYVKRKKYDMIISAKTIPSVIALAACFLAGNRKRLIVTVHESCRDVIASHAGIRKLLFFVGYKYFYRYAHRLVAVSRQTATDVATLAGIPHERVSIIYNPIVTEELLACRNAPVDHPWLQDKQKPVILTAGRFSPEKNFGLLLRAFAQLHKKHPCRLILLGDGQERTSLARLARDLSIDAYVSMPGFVENPYPYMAHADMFVLSSEHEALPTVLIEAMACGCPVISTDCPSGPREILDNGEYGTLVPVNDANALANAMEYLLQTLATTDHGKLQKKADQFSQANAIQHYLELAA